MQKYLNILDLHTFVFSSLDNFADFWVPSHMHATCLPLIAPCFQVVKMSLAAMEIRKLLGKSLQADIQNQLVFFRG